MAGGFSLCQPLLVVQFIVSENAKNNIVFTNNLETDMSINVVGVASTT